MEEQEKARRWIGLTLLALLIFVVLAAVLATVVRQTPAAELLAAVKNKDDAERLAAMLKLSAEVSKADSEALTSLLNVVFGPVVALIGSVTGYYFGRRREK